MPGKYGVKETKELLDLGMALGEAGKQALADGKVNLFDLAVVLPVLPYVQPAIEDIKLVPLELGELDEADSAELLAYAKTKLPVISGDEVLKHRIYVYVKAGLAVAEAVAVSRS